MNTTRPIRPRLLVPLLVLALPGLAAAAQIFLEDVIIQGSAAIGRDALATESFSNQDTLRLKENNLRIHFDDTSASASFPRNDWRIVINGTLPGEGEFFAIEDSTAGTMPFYLQAGAPANSIRLNSAGNLGLRTDNPVVSIHAVNGNTPALRLEQNTSSGFTAQAWDLTANETQFSVRDATHSSKIPFRIRPNTPTHSLVVGNTAAGEAGNIGIGVASPLEALHVQRSNDTAKVLIEDTQNTAVERDLLEFRNRGGALITFNDTATGTIWNVGTRAGGELVISLDGNGGDEFVLRPDGALQIGPGSSSVFTLDPAGNLNIAGALATGSDRDRKEVIEDVVPGETLAKVRDLPITRWRFIDDASEADHIGPMAQDFYAAFEVGANERTIAPLDTAGVAFSAIQGLNEQLEAKRSRIAELQNQNAELQRDLEEVLKRLEALEAK